MSGTDEQVAQKRYFLRFASLRAGLRQRGSVIFLRLNGTSKEAAEKRLFWRSTSLRACLRQSGVVHFQELNVTAKAVPLRKIKPN